MPTLDGVRRLIKTSIHGRRIGLDNTERLAGPKGFRLPVTQATSDTTGTVLPDYGIVSVVTTTNDSWTLPDPVEGGDVILVTGSTSTGTHTIGTNIQSSGSSTGSITMNGANQGCRLVADSTSAWKIAANNGASIST